MLLQAARGLQDEDLTGTGARSRVQVSTDLGEGETKVWRNPNLPQHLSGGGSYGETRGLERERDCRKRDESACMRACMRACLQAHGPTCALRIGHGRGCLLISLALAEGLGSTSGSDEAEAGVFPTASSR